MDRKKAEESYARDHHRSWTLYKRACRVMPGGVSHNIRYVAPYPFYVRRAKGPYIYDVDDRRYLDLWMGHYTHILGHAFPPVLKAVTNFVSSNGYHFGLVHKEEVELAERIVELVPCAESVRFCSSGTEAGMYVLRLARAYTGRKKVMKVKGGWHGASTDLSCFIYPPFAGADSAGLPSSVEDEVVPVPFNDLEGTIEAMDAAGDDLAAFIVEPVIGAGGFIPPRRGYFERVKEELERRGALLIFDEVITGFRLGMGGAQQYLGVVPHLTTLGKIVGGGFPLGAVAGPSDILKLSDCTARSTPVLIGGGTFSCHQASMVAGLKVLDYLMDNASWLYALLEERGNRLRSITEDIFKAHGVGAYVTGVGSLFMVHFVKEDVDPNDPAVLAQSRDLEKEKLFHLLLMNRGVFVLHGGAISMAHDYEDLDRYFQSVSLAVKELQ